MPPETELSEDYFVFYCDTCQQEKNWEFSEFTAQYYCEVCGRYDVCNVLPLTEDIEMIHFIELFPV